MGHALDNTMQDILIRQKRMQGYCTLWLPGTDHASIATEARIVATMAEEGLTKEDVGREGFLERPGPGSASTAAGSSSSSSISAPPVTGRGSALRWTRAATARSSRFFCRLYEKGLIYRGERIINWCPHCKTTISDAEGNTRRMPALLACPLPADRRQRALSRLRPPAPRPSSAIPPSPSIRTTTATAIWWARRSSCRSATGRSPSWPTAMSRWTSEPVSSRSPPPTIPTTSRWDSATICRSSM